MGAMASVNQGRVDGRARETTETRLLALFARLVIAVGFLSSVADRFGLWGPAGSARVAWGNWNNFVAYTAVLNFFLPHWSAPILAVVVTISESSLGILLISGLWLRWTSALSAALLYLFAVAMSLALGLKPPLDYSVYSAAAAAALLFASAGKRGD